MPRPQARMVPLWIAVSTGLILWQAPESGAVPPQEVQGPGAEESKPLGGLPLRVVVRDGTTGKAVSGASLSLHVNSRAIPLRKDGWVPLEREGKYHVLASSPIAAGDAGQYRLKVDLPSGFVEFRPGVEVLRGPVSPLAEALEAEVMVWPEARVRLRVEDSKGDPVPEAELMRAYLGGWPSHAEAAPTDAHGETLVRRVPFIRGELVEILAATESGLWAWAEPLALKSPDTECLVVAVLPDEPRRVPMPEGEMFGGTRDPHRHLVLGERGGLRATVLQSTGEPAPGVRIQVGGSSGTTGPDGIAELRELPVGSREVRALDTGFHTEPVTVEIKAGAVAEVVLREAKGIDGEVVVVDAQGAPVAGAEVRVTCAAGIPYGRMRGKLHVLNIHTGTKGHALLPRLPSGPITVTACLGSRQAKGDLEAGKLLTLRLPPPEPMVRR